MDNAVTERNIKSDIKENLIKTIKDFVAKEARECGMPGIWGEPLVGFADVYDPYIRGLRNAAGERHQMPEEVMGDATVIIAYFVPFDERIPASNTENELASHEWAAAYEETNAMFARLNAHIIGTVHNLGYKAAVSPEAQVFYRDEIMSHWSFRHFAYAAGLGTFGLNNMLITEKGCAGRVNTVITNLDVETDKPKREEACLFKRKGVCGVCADRCPAGALTREGFDREKCFKQCLKNAAVHKGLGSSYASAAGEEAEDSGSEVCGKCVVGLPCTRRIP